MGGAAQDVDTGDRFTAVQAWLADTLKRIILTQLGHRLAE